MAAIRTCSYALIRSDDRPVPPAPMQPLPASTNIRQRPKSPAAFSTVSHAVPPSRLATNYSMCSTGFRSSPTPTPYATALLPMGDQAGETIYSKPESVCPSRISYYASSQLTQVSPELQGEPPPATQFDWHISDFDGTPGRRVVGYPTSLR